MELLTLLIANIPSSALPICFCVVACWFLYLKIGKDRKATKEIRDSAAESFDKRIALIENEIANIKRLDLDARLAAIETSLEYIKHILENRK